MMTHAEQPADRREATTTKCATRPRTLHSADLLRGEKTVEIVHGDDHYRLTVTRNGKLILQK